MSATAGKAAQLGRDELSRMTCVERLQGQLRTLVAQRQTLREREASRDELESNRLELGSRQRELSQALIMRYLCPAARTEARR